MRNLICLCMVLSTAAVALGQMNPFGGIMKQATDGFKQAAGMFPGMGDDSGPFGSMMKQFEGLAKQAGGPEQMQKIFEEQFQQFSEQGQKTMQPFMEKMNELKDGGASPEQYMKLLEQMKKAAGQ
ncbi:hypothetical protein HNY73_002651 [Argiope bruennichi]|uniref:Uncharacterized protein n=1 Tax=Argiope bruennichi TaxID=94029 RepID=A0A8T0FVH4_ARGBR|nr:hypothetical protein HNY73_002651 [Argiope bruennichi]